MAIYIHCPHCHQRLDNMRPDCVHCGTGLPPGVLFALAAAHGESVASPMLVSGQVPAHVTQATPAPEPIWRPPPTHHSNLRPWLAAALSLVCGLGQLYNGQVIKGLSLIVLGTAAIFSLQLPLGKIVVPLLWMYAIVDAYMGAQQTGA